MGNSSYFRLDEDNKTNYIFSQSSQGRWVNWNCDVMHLSLTTGVLALHIPSWRIEVREERRQARKIMWPVNAGRVICRHQNNLCGIINYYNHSGRRRRPPYWYQTWSRVNDVGYSSQKSEPFFGPLIPDTWCGLWCVKNTGDRTTRATFNRIRLTATLLQFQVNCPPSAMTEWHKHKRPNAILTPSINCMTDTISDRHVTKRLPCSIANSPKRHLFNYPQIIAHKIAKMRLFVHPDNNVLFRVPCPPIRVSHSRLTASTASNDKM